MEKKIVVLGAGPTGLGAAWRLQELKHGNFKLFEMNSQTGGLARSFTDEKGFTWDIGGHVQFSHYVYFDSLMDSLLKDEWLMHERESWVWIKNRFVPYPFQNNIRYLPKEDVWKCISALVDLYGKDKVPSKNFKEWILNTFGEGIAELFMIPYNFKVWAYPPEDLSYGWIGERVSVVDLKRVIENVLFEKNDLAWGPNNKFRFPLRGGTGEVWKRLSARIAPEKIFLNSEAVKINTVDKYVVFKDGRREGYDALISTIPLDKFLKMSDINNGSSSLIHSSVHIFGLGIKGKPPAHLKSKCWMYFPEDNAPFYRATVFSNYSPNNVPDIKKYWSLMLEVSESPRKKVDHEKIKDEVIEGAINTKLVKSKSEIIDVWHHFESYGYPTPSLKRDEALKVLKKLQSAGVYSRGRFGAWKYEVSNQDHSLMQGVEAVNNIVNGEKEETVWQPAKINSK
ncbi:MAG: amine oxidase [Nanoarchaeota archaeon]|nr:MAG: amine oxidase [Nanoarchaeota archaeon]